MKPPEIVTATQAELNELLTLARTSFPQKLYHLHSVKQGCRLNDIHLCRSL